MSEDKKLRESINQVEIEGFLSKKELKTGSKDGNDYIGGRLEVKVGETNLVPVEVYAKRLKKDGNENSIYKGLLTILNDYVSIEEGGIDNATKVRITNGKVTVQDYVNKNNELSFSIRYSSNFVNRVIDDTFDPKARYELEVIVSNFKAETDKEGEETGRGLVDGFFVDFMGNLKPVNFKVGEKMWSKFENKAEKGDTVIFRCDIVESVMVNTVTIESDYGDDEEKVIKRTVKERVARSASNTNDERAYEQKDIKAGLKSRTEYLEELKNKALYNGNKKDENDDDNIWDK